MNAPYLLGLTGSIGMGKSTTAAMFAALGVPVWDADAAVHRLYGPGGAAVAGIARLFPEAVPDGAVSREALRRAIAADPAALSRIEAVVHPLVAADRAAFIRRAAAAAAPVVVLDIPLLFETGAETGLDGIAVVSAPAEVQRQRVLARPGMTAGQLDLILSRQMPDREKRARATWVIDTTTLERAREQVHEILDRIAADRRSGGKTGGQDARDRS